MGICLDTDANMAQESEEDAGWKGGGNRQRQQQRSADIGTPTTNIAGVMPNTGKIKFDPPKVPVIFVLGGPGSGKVTHCDTLMQEKRGITHINMMDLLQQYALGNDMQDFSQISSKTVTEVLMLEMKMAPAAKAYLISGYPRSMRDVVEYTEKIQVVNGVILISWRQSVLQKQIDYGAKLGHVVLSLAKMELENFFKNVMPVADYFDQSDMLVAVNGERAPQEVYKDFRSAVLEILGSLENQEAALNGVTGMGRGMNDIPGSIVSVETAPSQQKTITESLTENRAIQVENGSTVADGVEEIFPNPRAQQPTTTKGIFGPNTNYPPVIWIIGGPGSNKASLCSKAVTINPGWSHISIGRLLRAISDSTHRANTENYAIKEALSAGELIPEKSIESILEMNMEQNRDKIGILIDAYPRNIQQVEYFEKKYKQGPPMILLDCSKLQLGRGRLDDTVSSFRRRLELFREETLPMLKVLDRNNRLTIIDGDTDSPSVQREFEKALRTHIQKLTGVNKNKNKMHIFKRKTNPERNENPNQSIQNEIIEDLEENVPGVVPTVSHHVSLANGYLRNSEIKNSASANTKVQQQQQQQQKLNGNIPNGGLNFRQMLAEADPIDAYI